MTKKLNWFDNVEHRNHPWPGLNWLTTAICVPDARKAVAFYTDVMNMVAISELEDDSGGLLFARIRYRGINFTINKEGWDSECQSPLTSGVPSPFVFYLYVDDAEKLVAAMVAAGGTVVSPAKMQFWGDLKARIKDPFGYIWDVAQKVGSSL
ncbi:VOC family protein [Polyangium sorediatum]|uniref:VOC family protein n=1 Tax=Polyangium sorediatum TaxID=889274 RepID=A0ABT6NUJ1_9BACT|nr:VOC family protein [Polyangium sorediatum]MDI1432010.1 VOC family protein [Polyangium sorediatum]